MTLLFLDNLREGVSEVCPKKAAALLGLIGVAPVVLITPSYRALLFERIVTSVHDSAPCNGLALEEGWLLGNGQQWKPWDVAHAFSHDARRTEFSTLYLRNEAMDYLAHHGKREGCLFISDWPEEIESSQEGQIL